MIIHMHRFYIGHIEGETALLTDAGQLHHLKDVLRLKTGDSVNVSDGIGNEFTGVITGITKTQAAIKVSKVAVNSGNPVKLTVACAIPKGSRMDEIIDHLTQLGVERIIPMMTERVVVKLDKEKSEFRSTRWQKIAQSAAQQSRQSVITTVTPVTDFNDVVTKSTDDDLKLIPHLSGERKLLRDTLAAGKPKSIIVLIGPEGDFTPEEVEIALGNGFTAVSLGDTVLRVATAAIAVASYIRLALGE
jgi:16S rRNA (uracil1498-N3)-methyltransferase